MLWTKQDLLFTKPDTHFHFTDPWDMHQTDFPAPAHTPRVCYLVACLLVVSFFFSKAPCPLSCTGFYCLGERNLMIFQQHSNCNLGGVYIGRRSRAPEQIWFQTAYLHPPETDESCSCLRVFILHCLAWVEAHVSLPHQWVFVRNFSLLKPLSTAPMVQVQLFHPTLLSSMRRGTKSSDITTKRCGKIEGLQKENHLP